MAKWRINLLVEADDKATEADVKSLVSDLTWVGGCRDPENDPMFESVDILEMKITKGFKRK